MMSDSAQIQIYYEISMSIGSSLDINQMLKQSLSTYMRKLNCFSGVILQKQDDSDNIRLEKVMSLPFIISKNKSYNIYKDILSKPFTSESYNEFTATLPISENMEDGSFYYIMNMPDFGILIIACKTAIAATIIKSLKPLNLKLASAANACLRSDALKKSEETLANLNIDLENRVKDRTSMLEDALIELKENIREREKAFLSLNESEEKYRTLINNLHSAVILIVENSIEPLNDVFYEIFQINKNDFSNNVKGLFNLIHKDSLKLVVENYKELIEKKKSISDFEIVAKRNNGDEFELDVSLMSVKYMQKDVVQVILKDVSEKKLMETQLNQSLKLESIGTLAAGIAHEINTPLQFVGDNTAFMKDAAGAILEYLKSIDKSIANEKAGGDISRFIAAIKEKAEEYDIDYLSEEIPIAIQQTQDGIKRVSKIVLAMKDFSHPGKKEKSFADINRGIDVTATISKNEWKYSCNLETRLDPALPLVYCVLDEINQVILNMIVNAAHAIEELLGKEPSIKGKITIETRQAGDFIEIKISDTGKGIKEENQNHLFDPFFTTKEVGKGTGQGLAIAHDIIVNKHGGEIFVHSAWEEGTTFTVRLPVHFDNN